MALITLTELRGIIANCAIEDEAHQPAVNAVQSLIDRYGPLAKVDSKKIIQILYNTKRDK